MRMTAAPPNSPAGHETASSSATATVDAGSARDAVVTYRCARLRMPSEVLRLVGVSSQGIGRPGLETSIGPASKTEQQDRDRTEKRIRDAIMADSRLVGKVRVFCQGLLRQQHKRPP
jgi:hypothetical protein